MSLAPVPTLDELAADPSKAAGLPVETARALLARCVVANGVLVGRIIAPQGADGDRLLKEPA